MKKYVAYYRVSTQKQGQSGLGLAAQQATVKKYLVNSGWPPLSEFTEVESGRKRNRPELATALNYCRLHKAILVIAKLDRLARDPVFLLQLQDAGIDFVACDMPDANRLTVGIMALVAEDEAKRASERTKAALAIVKARGKKLGGRRQGGHVLKQEDRDKAARGLSDNARAIAESYRLEIERLKSDGITSNTALAKALNIQGITTAQGKQWQATSVKRLLDRL